MMTQTAITLRVLDGADRGRVFENLVPPITIGREEGNTIQLNDERISRFHLKIQDDNDRLVLTDLDSTNGTKVNGEDIQLRILRFGDMIHIGRSVLLFGSRDQIADRLSRLKGNEDNGGARPDISSFDFDSRRKDDDNFQEALYCLDPPELPDRLSPGQAAQLAEILNYFHIRTRQLLASVDSENHVDRVTLGQGQWQNLVDMQSRLAEYLRIIGEPSF